MGRRRGYGRKKFETTPKKWIKIFNDRPHDVTNLQYAGTVGCSKSQIDKLPSKLRSYQREVDQGRGDILRHYKPKFPKLEVVARRLFNEFIEKGLPNRFDQFIPHLRELIARGADVEDTSLSSGWFRGFVKRLGMGRRKISGKKKVDDHVAANKFINELVPAVQEVSLAPCHQYNCDETAFKQVPFNEANIAPRRVKENSGEPESKTNSTVLFCGDATGNFRATPLILSNAKHRCLSGHEVDSVGGDGLEEEEEEEETPVMKVRKVKKKKRKSKKSRQTMMEEEEEEEEKSSSLVSSTSEVSFTTYDAGDGLEYLFSITENGWMKTKTFMSWFNHHFVPEATAYLKSIGEQAYGVLYVDNAGPHGTRVISPDHAFVVVFLPPNTTSIIQPMDQHVIYSTKRKYDKEMTNMIISTCLQEDLSYGEVIRQVEFHDFASSLCRAWSKLTKHELWCSWRNMLHTPMGGKKNS